MRVFYMLRGIPASGKSTFIKKHKLEDYTISSDEVRKLFNSPGYEVENTELLNDNQPSKVWRGLSQENNKIVWQTINEMLESRFKAGNTTILDATNINLKELNRNYRLAKNYNYRVYVVDFMNGLSLEEAEERNRKRAEETGFLVPDSVIKRMFETYQNIKLPNKFDVVSPNEMLETLNWRTIDLTSSDYKHVKVIGDIHSSGEALEEALSDFNDETLYIFVGDYFDRGKNPVKTMEVLDRVLDKTNTIFLEGNHENHIRKYLYGEKGKSRFFTQTLPVLLEHDENVTKHFLIHLIHRLQPVIVLTTGKQNFIITHAGLSSEQVKIFNHGKRAVLLNNDFFIRGVGKYEFDVDAEYEQVISGMDDEFGAIQIHGHRNAFLHSATEFKRIYNLEQKVEFGNELAVIDINLNNNGTKAEISYNPIKAVENIDEHSSSWDKFSEHINQYDYQHSKWLKSKPVNGHDDIMMYHFTEKAFKQGAWDLSTLSARGLYIDKTNHVVARGFNKFFNLNEREETSKDNVINEMANAKRVILSEKLDGFLGIVSYSPETGLFITSKQNGESYSNLAKVILEETLKRNDNTLDDLEEWLKADYDDGKHYSLLFEMISEQYDPHLVAYDEDKAVLLEVQPNTIHDDSLTAKQMTFHDCENKVAETAHHFGFETPFKSDISGLNVAGAKGLLDEIRTEPAMVFKYEGNVITAVRPDDSLFRVKVKTPYFKTMKLLRKWLEPLAVEIRDAKDDDEREVALLNCLHRANGLIYDNSKSELAQSTLAVNILLKVLYAVDNFSDKEHSGFDKFAWSSDKYVGSKLDVMRTLNNFGFNW